MNLKLTKGHVHLSWMLRYLHAAWARGKWPIHTPVTWSRSRDDDMGKEEVDDFGSMYIGRFLMQSRMIDKNLKKGSYVKL